MRSYDVLVTMDADWSHDPQYLPELVGATEDADVAIGSRYCAGGAIEGWPLSRRIMSRGDESAEPADVAVAGSRYAAARFAPIAWRRCERSIWTTIQATGYSYLEEILWHLHRAGATFAEVPITFRERRRADRRSVLAKRSRKVIDAAAALRRRNRKYN